MSVSTAATHPSAAADPENAVTGAETAARSWFQRSSDLWTRVRARGRLMKRDEEQPQRVAGEIARCDTALAALEKPEQK